MSDYFDKLEALEKSMCEVCDGLGKCDDAECGDIGYNEWECLSCNGTGIKHDEEDEPSVV